MTPLADTPPRQSVAAWIMAIAVTAFLLFHVVDCGQPPHEPYPTVWRAAS